MEKRLQGYKKSIKVAVMGCVVNGPGEAREADIGIAGGKGEAVLFIHGQPIKKLTGDNIYKVLIYFDQLYGKMDDREKRQLIEELISEIQIYEERQPNGQWLKSIKFRLPIIAEDMSLSLDNDAHVETVCLLSRQEGA
mgnify:FL=1